MKLVQFYLFTIFIARNSQVCIGSGYLTSDELEYLSERLYPAECTYLTTTLLKSFLVNCKPLNQSSHDTLLDRPQLHCLIKLEEWNEIALKDEKAHDRLEKILHEIGRPDLAAHLSKKPYTLQRISKKDVIVT